MGTCFDDYYKILGISRKATGPEIKRAFKKLALKYHPDKIKEEKDQEAAQKKFAQIANAYETLKDPKKKEEYDERLRTGNFQGYNTGGSKHGQENFGGFGNFNDFFSSFFNFDMGGGGKGQRRTTFNFGGPGGAGGAGGQGGGFNFGNFGGFGGGGGGGGEGFNFGGQQQQQGGFQQQQQKPKSPFANSKVIEINMSKLSNFFNRQEVWLILFYQPTTIGKMQKVWKELAEKESEFYKVAAINCMKDKEICADEFKIAEGQSNTVLGFPSKGGLKTSKQYKGKAEIKQFDSFAIQLIDAKIQALDKLNYFDFIENNDNKNIAILFNKKGNTPVIQKVIAQEFEKYFVFAEVFDNEKELVQKFKIKKFPSIILLTDGFQYQGQQYSGEMKKDQIQKFLKSFTASSGDQKNKEKKNIFKELIHDIVKQGTICGPKDKKYCLILIIDSNQNNNTIVESLNQIALQYKKDPLRFYFVHSNKIKFQDTFNNELALTKGPILLMVKGKKSQFSLMKESNFDKDSIISFIDSTLSGSASLLKLLKPISSAFN